jgi:hypothetical protein
MMLPEILVLDVLVEQVKGFLFVDHVPPSGIYLQYITETILQNASGASIISDIPPRYRNP